MGRNGRGIGRTAVGCAGLVALGAWLGPAGLAAQDGEALASALGCGACHRGAPGPEEIRAAAPAFGPGATPLAPDFVFTYLADPQRRRPAIAPARMPDFGLSEAERLALALFLAGEPEGGAAAAARERHPATEAEDGERLFRALNCAGCHAHPGVEPWSDGPDLAREGARVRDAWLRGYLADPVSIRPSGHRPGLGSRMPDFRLEPGEVEALAGWIAAGSSPTSAPAAVADAPSPLRARRTERLLRDRLSCLGCHAVGGEGGRIGPSLDGISERLTPAFVRGMIHDPAATVPGARMPGSLFQPDALDDVAAWLLHREGGWQGSPRIPPLELAEAGARVGGVPSEGAAGPPVGTLPPGAAEGMAEAAGRGRPLYQRWCAHCHGPAGGGDGWNARYLPVPPTRHASDSRMAERPDDTLFDGIHAGAWVLDGSSRMPAFGAALDAGQIRALVAYIRTLCDCLGPAWSRDGIR